MIPFTPPPGATMQVYDQPGPEFTGLGNAIIAIACRPRVPTLHRAKRCPLSTLRFRGMVPVAGWPAFLSAIDDAGLGSLVWLGFEAVPDAVRVGHNLENHGIARIDNAGQRNEPMMAPPHHGSGSIAG